MQEMDSHQVLQKAVEKVGAITDDGEVDQSEARKIRTQWQRLKRYGEAFVCACERGMFAET